MLNSVYGGGVFPVEYEGLHQNFFQYGKYGHKVDSCPNMAHFKATSQASNTGVEESSDIFKKVEKPDLST